MSFSDIWGLFDAALSSALGLFSLLGMLVSLFFALTKRYSDGKRKKAMQNYWSRMHHV